MKLADGRTALDQGWNDYATGCRKLAEGRIRLKQETPDAETKLSDVRLALEDGEEEYAHGLREYGEHTAEFQTEVADAEADLAENEQLLLNAKRNWHSSSLPHSPY